MVRPAAIVLALLLMLGQAAPAGAGSNDKARIEQVIRSLVEAQDGKDIGMVRANTWPEGHFAVKRWGEPRARYHRRRWSDFIFGGMGVNYRTRIVGANITIKASRATAWVREHGRRYYSDEFSGISYRSTDWIVLERRRGEWRALNWERSVREYGSDAEWHRRHP